jgi:hypothetical protein
MLKMVTDDEAPVQIHGASRILYAITADETPDVPLSIKLRQISFAENVTTAPGKFKRSV